MARLPAVPVMTMPAGLLTGKRLGQLRLTLELLLVAFFLGYGWLQREELAGLLGQLAPLGLLQCMLVYSLCHLLAAAATTRLLRLQGQTLSYRTMLGIHLRCLPAKYMPGGIWHTVGRGTELARLGIPGRSVAHLLLVEQGLSVWWSGVIGCVLASLVFTPGSRVPFLVLLLFWVAAPGIVLTLTRRLEPLGMLRKALLEPGLGLIYVAGWSCLAAAIVSYLALGGMAQANELQLAAAYLLSWVAGALVIFAPQGMGVFELAMSRAVTELQGPLPGLVWFLGSYRLVVLLADLLAWLVWAVLRRHFASSPSPHGDHSP